MVHQELSVAPDLTVAENVFLGNQPTNRLGLVQWRRMAREAGEQLKRFGIDVDPMSRLGDLPIGLQQLIEIARVLSSGARIIILDEPTSALSPPEVERLFATLKRLRDEGTSIVFISHFIEDILRVSDTVTVFRNGRKVAETAASETSKPALIEAMIGKGREALEETYTHDIMLPPPTDQPVVLNANGLTLAGRLREVSFEARAGEVLGIYGFMGCGQLELARILFGKIKPDLGTLAVAGNQKAFRSTADARRSGIAFVPESRRDMLFLQEPVYKNISISILDRISSLLLKPSRERAIANRQVEQLRIRPAAVDLDLGMLSGGNQQKVALAKWLSFRRGYWCCASRPAAWMSAPRTTSSTSSGICAPRGSPSSFSPPSRKRCCRSPTASSCSSAARSCGSLPTNRSARTASWKRREETGMTSGESVTVAADRKRPRGLAAMLRSQMRNIAPFLTLICLFSFFAVASPSFATLDNFGNILTQIRSPASSPSASPS